MNEEDKKLLKELQDKGLFTSRNKDTIRKLADFEAYSFICKKAKITRIDHLQTKHGEVPVITLESTDGKKQESVGEKSFRLFAVSTLLREILNGSLKMGSIITLFYEGKNKKGFHQLQVADLTQESLELKKKEKDLEVEELEEIPEESTEDVEGPF